MGNRAPKKTHKVVIIGLDNSGKTTILNHLTTPAKSQKPDVAPTIGVNQEIFDRFKVRFQAFDMSGQAKYRQLWDQYIEECDVVLFVIDASDSVRFGVARSEFDSVFEHPTIVNNTNIPVWVLWNKQDLADSVGPNVISDVLGLADITTRQWNIIATVGTTGEGVDEGIQWVHEVLK